MTFRTCVECVWRCFGTREKLKKCDEQVSQKTNCVRRRMFIRQSSGRRQRPHPTCKCWGQSVQRGRVCTCVKLSLSGVYFFLSFFRSHAHESEHPGPPNSFIVLLLSVHYLSVTQCVTAVRMFTIVFTLIFTQHLLSISLPWSTIAAVRVAN